MGFFDIVAPVFGAIDGAIAYVLPPFVRLLIWGIFAGWLTMVAYRKLSNQQKITELKNEQKIQQKVIVDFDGEMAELVPLVKRTLGLGFRQLGLAIGPALLATLPVLFLVAWVAGAFGYHSPLPGQEVRITSTPAGVSLESIPSDSIQRSDEHWNLTWPEEGNFVNVSSSGSELLALPTLQNVPVLHKKKWWNTLFANPIGYLPDDSSLELLNIELPEQEFFPVGPHWMRGWMFMFFSVFLLSSLGFKFLLRID